MGGGGGNGPGGGRGNRGQMDPEMAQRFTQMREAMNELEQGSEQSLAKILDRGQLSRLKQIQLQMAGIPGLLRPDMVEKLNLDEEQVEQIRGLLTESGQARMENGRARFDMMKAAFPDVFNRGPNGGGQNGGGQNANDPNANDPNGGQNGAAQNGAGQNGNGQNGNGNGRGGRANFRDPAFREAMQKFMESPETKAKMEQIRVQDEKIQNQLTAAVNRVLSKRQAAAYKKMLGAPFDMSKMFGGPGGGPWNRGRNADPAAAKAAGKTQASEAGKSGDAASTKPAAKGNPSSTAKSKRKSLRELRGLD